MEIIIALISLLVGLVIGYLISAQNSSKKVSKIAGLESRLEEAGKNAALQLQQLRDNHENILLEKEKAYSRTIADKEKMFEDTLRLQQQNSHEALEALQGRFDETVAKMKAELESLTSEILKRRQEEFTATNRENMSQILEPLSINLRQMKEAVVENTTRHAQLGGQLASNIQLMLQHSDLARQSAEKLTEALRRGGKVQGNWGEQILTELLEMQGLHEGVHFDTQTYIADADGNPVLSDETGRKLQPDVILHLDRKRDVIIDAKVSLTSFLDYIEAESEEARETALKKHIDSIEKHVKELASKNYSSFVRAPRCSVNYVIMFVPNSGALYLAANNKPGLWRKAMEQGVYIADEQTLYAALKIIDLTWRQITQAENHEKVYGLANEMLDRVARFMEKFTDLGAKLKSAQKAYDEAKSKLKDEGQSIPTTCRKLVDMGAKPKKMPKGVDPSLLGMGATTDEPEENTLIE